MTSLTLYLVFNCASICERNELLLSAPWYGGNDYGATIGLAEQIIQPLLQQSGMEALRDCISDVQLQLHRGLLWELWEVEIMLITTVRVGIVSSRCSVDC